MLKNSIPLLVEEAEEVRQALKKFGPERPTEILAAEIEDRITALEIAALEAALSELNAVDAVERMQLIKAKGEKAEELSDYIVQTRAVVKEIFGTDSVEYKMVNGIQAEQAEEAEVGG